MITKFEVVNYRGISNLSVQPIRRINLITGANGVGKTSLAEAMWLFYGRYNPTILWTGNVQRRGQIEGSSPLSGLGQYPVELRGTENRKKFGVKFEYEETNLALGETSPPPANRLEEAQAWIGSAVEARPGPAQLTMLGQLTVTYRPGDPSETITYPVAMGAAGPVLSIVRMPRKRPTGIIVSRANSYPVDDDTISRFSEVIAKGERDRLMEMLSLVHPIVKDIQVLFRHGKASLWAELTSGQLLPLEALGGGAVRLLNMFVNFYAAEGGIIVIDEIENGIHHRALPEMWKQIRILSKLLDVQCVATTHSLECAQAAASLGEEGGAPADFALHHLYSRGDVRQAETYTDEKLIAALELGFEVR